jgi:hypothetical protein
MRPRSIAAHPNASISRIVAAIPTTSTKYAQALIALLPGVTSHERQHLAANSSVTRLQAKKGGTLAPWAVSRSCEGLALFLENPTEPCACAAQS